MEKENATTNNQQENLLTTSDAVQSHERSVTFFTSGYYSNWYRLDQLLEAEEWGLDIDDLS